MVLGLTLRDGWFCHRTAAGGSIESGVNGQEILPTGGQQSCPPMVSRVAH
jgi:hypothetical protein